MDNSILCTDISKQKTVDKIVKYDKIQLERL